MDTQQLATAAVVDLQRTKSSAERIWEDAANGHNGMDKTAFVELMNGLWSGMGRTVMPDKTTLRVWYLCLHDLSVAQFGRAVQRYLTERSAEFVNVQMIRELSGVQLAGEEAGLLAWNMAVFAVTEVGSYAVPVFADPAISHVLDNLGGWDWFCGQKPDALRSYVRPHFLRAYASFAKMRTLQPVRLKSLTEQSGGRSEQRLIDVKQMQRIGG